MSARLFWHLPYPAHWLVEKLFGWQVLAWFSSTDAGSKFEYHWQRVDG